MNLTEGQEPVYDLMTQGYSLREIADELGISWDAARCRRNRIRKKLSEQEIEQEQEDLITDGDFTESFSKDFKQNSCTIQSKMLNLKTVEDVLEYADIDTDVWEVERVKTSSWEMPRKNKESDITWTNGVMNGYVKDHGGFYKEMMWQITVWLKKKVSEPLKDALSSLTSELLQNPPVLKKVDYKKTDSIDRPHLLEISLVDHHFAKMCVNGEGIKESELLYQKAVENLINKSITYNIDRVVLPIGSDFFHVDNWKNTTTKGTPQDMDGGLLFDVYKRGCRSIVESIYLMREIAPVEILWIPGNHDLHTSFFLATYLDAYFNNDDRVIVDIDSLPRKYKIYGSTCIGYTHGSEEKDEALARLIMSENLSDRRMGKTKHFEFHRGHFHKKKQLNYISTETLGPVKIIVLPSLSGTDYWHFRKGFVGSKRAAECYLYDYDYGNIGYFSCGIEEIF